MPWYAFALLAAGLTATAAILEKRSLRREHAASFSAALSLAALAVSLSFLPVADISTVTVPATILVAGVAFMAAGAFLLVTKAMRHLEVSTVSPLLAAEPAVVSALAFFLLGENLSLRQATGVCAIVLGTYALETAAKPEFKGTWRSFLGSRHIRYLGGAMLLYSISSLFDRVVLSRFGLDPAAYIVLAHICVAFAFVSFVVLKYGGWRDIVHAFRTEGALILLIAVITVFYRFFQAQAVALASIGLVIAIKRTSALFTTIIGGELFHEHNLWRKALACAVMVAGAGLVVI